MATVVVVQSDSLSGWIGLAGVAVGVLLTGGFEWLRGIRAGRERRQRELRAAVDDLRAAALGLMTASAACSRDQHKRRNFLAWYQVMEARNMRIRSALAAIRRLGSEEFGNLFHVASSRP